MKCPDGHESTATDYCDVCGVAMVADAGAATPDAAAAAPAAPATPASTDCPNCHAANLPDALFCEACGYDFTTGTLPKPLDAPDSGSGSGSGSGSASGSAMDDAPTGSVNAVVASPLDLDASLTGANTSPGLNGWVAEVWVDPDWYADQESTDPLPSPGLPLVVRLKNTSVLIGRASRSRNINPDIDLSSDTGISRRHAQLTTDGSRWWVEDLGSSNGTYVGSMTSGLPQAPITQGQKQEVGVDDRIYLGAWTRIILRKATPGEF